jgi:hypothetical protein
VIHFNILSISDLLFINLAATVKYKRSAGFGAIHCPPAEKFIKSKNAQF